jgi:iron only hydrogenase large subunit-like protein
VGGGGQPYETQMSDVRKRQDRLYTADANAETRYSHENKSVAELYEEHLGKPLGTMSHKLLHRKYTDRSTPTTREGEGAKIEENCCR